MSAVLEAAPRLLNAVELAQPLSTLEPAIFRWASGRGTAVFDEAQLKSMYERERVLAMTHGLVRDHVHDLYLAMGALNAARRRLPGGFRAYAELWEITRVVQRVSKGDKTDFSRLRELEVRVGGILLNDRACPLTLLVPQADRTWITLGFESVIHFASSPLSGGPIPPVLRTHVPPTED